MKNQLAPGWFEARAVVRARQPRPVSVPLSEAFGDSMLRRRVGWAACLRWTCPDPGGTRARWTLEIVIPSQLCIHLQAASNALPELRDRISELLASAEVSEANRHDVLLVAQELAANAIEHGSGPNDQIEVRCSLAGRRLQLAVFDNSRGRSTPVAYTPQAERARGRGLCLVERLSDSWAETIVGGRRRVTAQLTVDVIDESAR